MRARQLEKSYSACLEEGHTEGGSVTCEAATLRPAAWREKKDLSVRARQLEREEERERKRRSC